MIRQKEDVENLDHTTLVRLVEKETNDEIESILQDGGGSVAEVGDTVSIKEQSFNPVEDTIDTDTNTGIREVIDKHVEHIYIRTESDESDEYQPADQMQTHVTLRVSKAEESD